MHGYVVAMEGTLRPLHPHHLENALARKDTLLEEWTLNGTGSHKRNSNAKFEKISHLLWEWYVKAIFQWMGHFSRRKHAKSPNNSARHH